MILNLAASLVRLLEFLLFARAILSWFPQTHDSFISEFLYSATEPLIMPFRALLSRFEIIRMMPLDISFLCAVMALEAILLLLYRL